MKDIGLTNKEINTIRKVIAGYPQVEKVVLYGSRAKGNYNSRSDIDLTAIGKNLNRHIIAKMLMDFEELHIPYIIDLQDFESIRNEKLIEHITNVGILFYEKSVKDLLTDSKDTKVN